MSPPVHGAPTYAFSMNAHGQVAMTPHGLPPITPSMPTFSFMPMPSPGAAPGGGEGEGAGPYDMNSMMGMNAGMPNMSSMGSMGSMGLMSPPAPAPGAGPGSGMPHSAVPRHVFQPFTPGPPMSGSNAGGASSAMSPGAFWGRPGGAGGGAAPSYLNPAVGSPVLMQPPHAYAGVYGAGSQPGSPSVSGAPYGWGGGAGEDAGAGGYFPPVLPRSEGYFPPVSSLGSSGLAHEILREGSAIGASAAAEGAEGEVEVEEEEGTENGEAYNGYADDSPEGDGRQSTSSGKTSWRSSEESVRKDDRASPLSGNILAEELAGSRLGTKRPPPKPVGGASNEHTANSVGSYAAVAAKASRAREEDDGSSRSRGSPSGSQGHGGHVAARSSSMGAEGTSARPRGPVKTHSDETRVAAETRN